MIQHFSDFWRKNPALYYGLAILFGISLALKFSWIILLPFTLTACSNNLLKSVCFVLLLVIAYAYAYFSYQFPTVPLEGLPGKAIIEISSVRLKKTFYGKQWTYRGRIKSFDNISKNIDFTLNLPYDEKIIRPPANQDYEILATLKTIQNDNYYLKVSKNTPWKPIPYTFSLAEWRYQMKTALSNYIRYHYPNARAASFLSGIATGEFDDRTMSQEFSQFGLQHIMAISGFHFAIIASILSSLLKFLLPKRPKIFILVTLLSGYFLFLGSGPSILRAWIAIVLALVAMWIRRQGTGLNSLGVALIIVLIFDPLHCLHMGFQFSFITTAAILLLYGTLDQVCQKLFYHRPLATTSTMTKKDQHAYCLLTTLRQALALALAVNLVALPMTLYYFQSFPVLSLIYNLFFPFLVSLSMLLLLLGFIIPGVHDINDLYTSFILNFTHQMPNKINFLMEFSHLSSDILIVFLTLVFVAGIYYQSLISKQPSTDFVYL